MSADPDPSLSRGFDPDSLYDYSGLDSINLFNGNLVLSIPIGQQYPVGDGFTYGLMLTYNSNVWDHRTRQQSNPPQSWPYAEPRGASNAGLGWVVSLGGTLYGPNHVDSLDHQWRFEGEDGSEHLFYDSLHEGESSQVPARDCLFTRDGSYLRLCEVPNIQPARWTVEFPGGTVRTFSPDFGDRFRLTTMADRLGNWVSVGYGAGGLTWNIFDSVGRAHTVTFDSVGGKPVLSQVALEGFGGQPAVWTFSRQQKTVQRSCKDVDPQTSATVSVPMLTEIQLPAAAGSYTMADSDSYYLQPGCALSAPRDLPGILHRIQLPTSGQLEWEYQDYGFPFRSMPGRETLSGTSNTGVATKKALNAAGLCADLPSSDCTWTYSQERDSQLGSEPDIKLWTEVTSPSGDRTLNYFKQTWLSQNPSTSDQGWDYGLPYTTKETILDSQGETLYLSREVFSNPSQGNQLLRRVYVRYDRDQLRTSSIPVLALDWKNSNRRLVAQRTVYHDDPHPGGALHFKEERFSDFDGLGHFRVTDSTGDFRNDGASNFRSQRTEFNPDRGMYEIDPATNLPTPSNDYMALPDDRNWVLGTYDFVSTTHNGTDRTDYCFDTDRGRLKRERHRATGALTNRDVIVVHNRNRISAGEIRYQDKFYGGDGQSVSASADLCALNPTSGNPDFRIRHTFIDGVKSKTENQGPGGAPLDFLALDRQIDPSTGLVSQGTDPAGLVTNYEYDALGRMRWIKPDSSGDAWTEVVYTASSGSLGARVDLRRRPNGSQTGVPLKEKRTLFDPWGRPSRDERKIPGQGWTATETVYDAQGWVQSVSERGSSGSGLPYRTEYKEYDAFGRPLLIELPDHSANGDHQINLGYAGDRKVTRQESVATDLAGGESPKMTEELYDIYGRLWRVREDSGTGGATVNSDYLYDAADNLTQVKTAGQIRSFVYDGRGFLLSESHPEVATTIYSDYDSRGKARRLVRGASGGLFDLTYEYDAAERLIRIAEGAGQQRDLKVFAYGKGATAANRSRNKISSALRHNYVSHPNNGAPLDVVVTESYIYGGIGGRVSVRDTTLNTGQSFTQGWTYTPLGNVATQDYPECTFVADCETDRRPRQVSHTYDQGMLTAVPGFADSITYHPNGLLSEIHFTGNGVIYGQGLDPHWMQRPGSLYQERGGQLAPWMAGNPSLMAGQPVELFFSYDGTGNVKRWGDERYRYDLASRLVEMDLFGGVDRQDYTFDTWGNLVRIETQRTGVPLAVLQIPVSSFTNRLTSETYDAAGNQVTSYGITSVYDPFNMVTRQTGGGNNSSFAYTVDDERIWSVDATVTPWRETFTLRDLDGTLSRRFETDSGAADLAWEQDYVRRNGLLLATVQRAPGQPGGEEVHSFLLNHLGTPLLTVDGVGTTVDSAFLFPFGEDRSLGARDESLRFTGHERDYNGSGDLDDLDYMHARYYRPKTGRFLSPDPVLGRVDAPQSWNRYSYVGGDPINHLDPTGRLPITVGAPIKVVAKAYRFNAAVGRFLLGKRPGSQRISSTGNPPESLPPRSPTPQEIAPTDSSIVERTINALGGITLSIAGTLWPKPGLLGLGGTGALTANTDGSVSLFLGGGANAGASGSVGAGFSTLSSDNGAQLSGFGARIAIAIPIPFIAPIGIRASSTAAGEGRQSSAGLGLVGGLSASGSLGVVIPLRGPVP